MDLSQREHLKAYAGALLDAYHDGAGAAEGVGAVTLPTAKQLLWNEIDRVWLHEGGGEMFVSARIACPDEDTLERVLVVLANWKAHTIRGLGARGEADTYCVLYVTIPICEVLNVRDLRGQFLKAGATMRDFTYGF